MIDLIGLKSCVKFFFVACFYENHISQSCFMSSVSHGSQHTGNLNHLRCNYKLITDYPLHAFSSSQPSLPFHNPFSILPCSYSNSSNYVLPVLSTKGGGGGGGGVVLFYIHISATCCHTLSLMNESMKLTRGQHVVVVIWYFERVLMEILCSPSEA